MVGAVGEEETGTASTFTTAAAVVVGTAGALCSLPVLGSEDDVAAAAAAAAAAGVRRSVGCDCDFGMGAAGTTLAAEAREAAPTMGLVPFDTEEVRLRCTLGTLGRLRRPVVEEPQRRVGVT